jgi:prolyl-tRNA synthetase
LWQEGHTAHATKEEAEKEAVQMMNVYADFVEGFMGIPVLKGLKTESEKFAGAVDTYCIEALMQDGKALQAGTSHFLGQNFAKAFDVKFLDKTGRQELVWGTSWGSTTRLIGALIMTHSDDNGLVLPPNLAPFQVVIVPIFKKGADSSQILAKAEEISTALRANGVSVKLDDRDSYSPGWKFSEYELKGVPLRIALGPRDLENGTLELARRDTLEKQIIPIDEAIKSIPNTLKTMQAEMFNRALEFRNAQSTEVDTYEEFKEVLDSKAGFVYAHWDGTAETEERIKNETKATIRCIPFGYESEGKCMVTGKPSKGRVVFARAY